MLRKAVESLGDASQVWIIATVSMQSSCDTVLCEDAGYSTNCPHEILEPLTAQQYRFIFNTAMKSIMLYMSRIWKNACESSGQLVAYLLMFAALFAAVPLCAEDVAVPEPLRPFFFGLREKVTDQHAGNVVVGKEGWLFFVPELRTLSVGPFWGEAARTVAKAGNPDEADPLPAIRDFQLQCEKAGVELLILPVPAKATIYPDYLADAIPVVDGIPSRNDIFQQTFYQLLSEQKVTVLDLTPDYQRARAAGEQLYCKQDTHWTGRGCEIAAAAVYNAVKDRPWLQGRIRTDYTMEDMTIAMPGDMNEMLPEAQRLPAEKISLRVVKEKIGQGWVPVTANRQSPVLLLGDSHTLIYQAGGDMHASGAGFAAHLSREFGFGVDVVGVRGSGATSARVNLLRRNDQLAGKKLIIWCMTVREFTEATAWKLVPIIR